MAPEVLLRALAVALFSSSVAGCFLPPNMTEKLSDASYTLNQASRFGRMDVAMENVARAAREQFAKDHIEWGRGLRIVDVEITGLDMVNSSEGDVFVSVSWQREDESNLRVTHLTQRWKSEKGTWLLATEARKAGDFGVLGEPTVVLEPTPEHAQFPTRVIHGE